MITEHRRTGPSGAARALIASALLLVSGAGHAADLEIVVTGLSSAAGNVHMALYDNPDKFPDSDGMVVEVEAPITGSTARHVFKDLAAGRYAVATYHDENDNDEFDQGFLGIPLEDYAFSSGATAFLSPPSFDAAAFRLTVDQRLSIPIND